MKPYRSTIHTIPEVVLNLSAEHYEEHIPALEAWIDTHPPKEKQT